MAELHSLHSSHLIKSPNMGLKTSTTQSKKCKQNLLELYIFLNEILYRKWFLLHSTSNYTYTDYFSISFSSPLFFPDWLLIFSLSFFLFFKKSPSLYHSTCLTLFVFHHHTSKPSRSQTKFFQQGNTFLHRKAKFFSV